MAPKFAIGDQVAWSHAAGALFGRGAVLARTAVRVLDPEAVVGTVTTVENAAATYFGITFEGGDVCVLTSDELIKVEG